MTQEDLLEERRRAINLLKAYEAGNMISIDESASDDFTNDHTELKILTLRTRIGELERRIAGHPDHSSNQQMSSD